MVDFNFNTNKLTIQLPTHNQSLEIAKVYNWTQKKASPLALALTYTLYKKIDNTECFSENEKHFHANWIKVKA